MFYITGEPGNGKTTLSQALSVVLSCPVLTTDQLYIEWIRAHHRPRAGVRLSRRIKPHYLRLPTPLQRSWHTHLDNSLQQLSANPVSIAEGWLLGHHQPEVDCRVIKVHMRRFRAQMGRRRLGSGDRDYREVVAALVSEIS